MSNLDDKLRDLLTEIIIKDDENLVEYTDSGVFITDKSISKIKDAFTEANWFDVTTSEFKESLLKSITVTVNGEGMGVGIKENHE